MRRTSSLAVAIAIGTLVAASVPAFHSDGVGACGGCHGKLETVRDGSSTLRQQDNPTDICLRCHERTHGNSWGGNPTVPGPNYGGGPFVFLLEDNLNDGPGGGDPLNWIRGHQAGHNVLSAVRGTARDPDWDTAPGGTYPSSNLHCTSCHDPHGKGGNFRLLYGSDHPDAKVNREVFTYTTPAPQAVGIDVDGRPESDGHHTAYLSGMSRWCGNCHARYHDSNGSANLNHSSESVLGTRALAMYNRYRGTGFLDGDGTDAYIAAVPLEFAESTTGFRGPVPSNARIMCLTCHRAHASSGPRSGRWDFNIDTWADEGVASGSFKIPNPYGSTAGQAQGSLCEKCHGSDAPTGP